MTSSRHDDHHNVDAMECWQRQTDRYPYKQCLVLMKEREFVANGACDNSKSNTLHTAMYHRLSVNISVVGVLAK